MKHKNHVEVASKSDNTWFVLILILYMLISTMPLVAQLTGGIVLMGLNVIILAVIIFCSTDTVNEYFSFLFPAILLALLNLIRYFLENGGVDPIYFYRLSINFVPLTIGYWVIKTDDEKINKILSWTLLAAFSVTIVTTYIGLLSNPGAARYLATVSNTSDVTFRSYYRQNIAGFSFIYNICIIFPIIIGFYKQKKINRIVMIALTVVLILYFLAAEYATATILLFFNLILLFQSKKFTLKKVFAFLLVLVFMFFIFSPAISSAFSWVAERTPSKVLAERFEAVAKELNGETSDKDSDTALRKKTYESDLQGFSEHPLLGGWIFGKVKTGGHSYLLGILSNFGLIGAAIVFCIYKKLFNIFYMPHKDKEYFGYMVWSFIVALFIGVVNTGEWYFPIAVAVPIITAYFAKAEENGKGQIPYYESTLDNK